MKFKIKELIGFIGLLVLFITLVVCKDYDTQNNSLRR